MGGVAVNRGELEYYPLFIHSCRYVLKNRNVLLLAVCQAMMLSSTSLIMTTSALVGVVLAPRPAQATLPLGITYFCIMLTMIPASLYMRRHGRKAGFLLGATFGAVGGMTAAYSIHTGSFFGFCVGSGLFGIASGFGQFYRFAAAEVVSLSARAKAISWVLAGGLVAAFVGPNVARLTREVIPGSVFAASYACIALFCLGVIVAQLLVRYPTPTVEETAGDRRPLTIILSRPVFLVAVICAMIAYGTMNLLMTSTPLAMSAREMPFGDTAMVIQWHIVGMFAPSFFTGHLIHRFGVLQVMFVGVVLLTACALVTLTGEQTLHFFTGLLLLGLGWNFLFVGATTLLTQAYLPAEKGIVQGINDFLVFSATAFTALSSGYFHHLLGWERLNLFTLPMVALAGVLVLLLGITRQSGHVTAAS
jgi:MFS family permease